MYQPWPSLQRVKKIQCFNIWTFFGGERGGSAANDLNSCVPCDVDLEFFKNGWILSTFIQRSVRKGNKIGLDTNQNISLLVATLRYLARVPRYNRHSNLNAWKLVKLPIIRVSQMRHYSCIIFTKCDSVSKLPNYRTSISPSRFLMGFQYQFD